VARWPAARKSGRYGHRDATMILIAFRHGLRAFELCDLQWHQVELAAGRRAAPTPPPSKSIVDQLVEKFGPKAD
jgi:hypothetical protein